MLFLSRFSLFRQSLVSVAVCISKYRPERRKVFGRNTLAAEQEEDSDRNGLPLDLSTFNEGLYYLCRRAKETGD